MYNMSKRKSEFHQLEFINPFDKDHIQKMVHPDWLDRWSLMQWRISNAKSFNKNISDNEMDLLDIDELITQWDIDPEERKIGPKTCNMIYKELCLVLRLVDAEHQDAMKKGILPGVVYSNSNKKYMFTDYDLDVKDVSKAESVKLFDTEKEAFEAYKESRDRMIDSIVDKALMYKLINSTLYMDYFNKGKIRVRSYEYYKEKKYLNKSTEEA